MGKNGADRPSKKKGTNVLAGLRFFNMTKHTAAYWILLFAVSGILLAIELLGVHRILGLTDTAFWQELIAPFYRELELNFVNLYTSQISTTFLVTAFLSFLGGKDDPIYWTSAMEYKLINPKGTSLRDITWYCLGTLVTSLVAMFFRGSLMFLFSFGINLLSLSVITCRMILAFFARPEIKRQLQRDFLKADIIEQQAMLGGMEDNIVQAAHNHNVAYLQECVQFFRFLEEQDALEFTQNHFERLRWFFQIIPDQLNDIRWGIFIRLANMSGIGDLFSEKKRRAAETSPSLEDLQNEHESVKQALEEKTQQRKELEGKRKTGRVKKDIAALQQQIDQLNRRSRRLTSAKRPYLRATSPEKDNRRRLQDDIMILLHNHIHARVFTARDAAMWCNAATALSRKNISELFALAGKNKVSVLHFHRDFKNIIYLLKAAYECHNLLDDYIFMLQELNRFVEYALRTLPEGSAARCYDWQDTLLIFQCICDESALIERSRSEFLVAVLGYSASMNDLQRKQLSDLVTGCSAISDKSKEPLLQALNATES